MLFETSRSFGSESFDSPNKNRFKVCFFLRKRGYYKINRFDTLTLNIRETLVDYFLKTLCHIHVQYKGYKFSA